MCAVSNLKILLTREQIAQRVKELGAEITRDFAGQAIIFVGVLKGAAIFLSDLARKSNWTRRLTLSASRVTGTGPILRMNFNMDGTRPAR